MWVSPFLDMIGATFGCLITSFDSAAAFVAISAALRVAAAWLRDEPSFRSSSWVGSSSLRSWLRVAREVAFRQ